MRTYDGNPDVALLQKALDHVTAHPEEHNQRFWAKQGCGTTYCIAGLVAVWAGAEPIYSRIDGAAELCVYKGTNWSIFSVALEQLNLSPADAMELFHTYDLGKLWRKANRLTGGALVVPLEFQRARGPEV